MYQNTPAPGEIIDPTLDSDDPCRSAGNYKAPEIKPKIDAPKTQLQGNQEQGFMFTKLPSIQTTDFTPGPAGSGTVDYTINNPVDGFVHTHYDGLLPIFSVIDLFEFLNIFNANKMANPTQFTFGLVTSNGVYNLSISDLAQFTTFAASSPSMVQLENKYAVDFGIGYNTPELVALINFATFLNDSHTGLTVSKATTAELDHFVKYETKKDNQNNTVVTPVGCP